MKKGDFPWPSNLSLCRALELVLKSEMLDTLLEAKVLVERWRREYNQIRPHSSLGYRPPDPEVIIPMGA
jgi:transposase InsO family protein